jgi:hypothetical protein
LDTNLTATASRPAERSLHDICEAARLGHCGPFCGALPGDECVVTSAPVSVPVTGDTPVRPARGYHMARFARAQSRGLITAAEFAAVTGAGSPTPARVIFDTRQEGTAGRDRTVPGPFKTSSRALLALRPDDGSLVGPEPRADLLRDTLSAAGVELGERDRAILRWLAGLDVPTIAPVIGWVSRAGRGPVSAVIVQALAGAIAYRTALTAGCPDCSRAAPEGCADHREDAARAGDPVSPGEVIQPRHWYMAAPLPVHPPGCPDRRTGGGWLSAAGLPTWPASGQTANGRSPARHHEADYRRGARRACRTRTGTSPATVIRRGRHHLPQAAEPPSRCSAGQPHARSIR